MADKMEATSDWAKNWNGSIAVKVTAVTLWTIMLLAFILTMPFVTSFENSILRENAWETEQIANAVHFAADMPMSKHRLKQSLRDIIRDSDIRYVAIDFQGEEMEFGEKHDDNYSKEVLLNLHDHTAEQKDGIEQVLLYVEFPPMDYAINIARAEIGSAVVAFVVLFGLFMFWVNRNIVHTPFTSIVDLAQKIGGGETSLRLDVSRSDEFGVLAKFLNQMLDTLEANQLALKKANEELVNEITNREEALAASQQKSAFLANMSHEIRTPLASIIGYTERLRFNKARDENEKNEMLDIVMQNGSHLLHLINDILDLSKVEANKLEIEKSRFSIFETVNHIRDLLHDKAMERNNRLTVYYEFPIPEFVYADPVRTKQIILNLCTNAVRFTEKGIITIGVRFDPASDFLAIEVKDSGRGMTQEEMSRLFKPFTQADASIARNYGGTGLGLAISKRLAEMMGGDISVQSVKGLGSSFTCKIKAGCNQGDRLIKNISEISKPEAVTDRGVQGEKIKGKILLVEDTPEIQRLVKAYLEDYGIEIETANDGQQGVKMALDHEYDVVLMDVQMPVMNGKDATRLLRKKGYGRPIIALTADAISQHADEFMDMGFNETLTKPIEVRKLIERVQHHINNKSEYVAVNKASAQDVVASIRADFVARLPETIREIELAVRKGNIAEAQALLHKIKGIAGTVGLTDFTTRATEVSDILHANKHDLAMDKLFEMAIIADSVRQLS